MKPLIAQLSNGLAVIVHEMPQSSLVAVSLFVRGGSRVERDDEIGVAHFMEHMLFHGSKKFPSEQIISDLVEGHGGEFNAYTSRERICCFIHGFREQVETACDILAHAAFCSIFSPRKIATEREAILQEIAEKNDDPSDYGAQIYTGLIWGEHPMGREISGSSEAVIRYRQKHLKSYHERFFAPNNMVLAFAGNISQYDAMQYAKRYFGCFPARVVDIPKNPMVVPKSEQIIFSERPTQQAICFLGRTPVDWISCRPEHTANQVALELLMHILGDGISSRLFREVRTKYGLAYSIFSTAHIMEDFGYFSIYFGADPKNIARTIEIVSRELDKVVADCVTEEELAKAKNSARRAYAKASEDSLLMANTLGQIKSMGRDSLDLEENFKNNVLPVTCHDIRTMARRIFEEQHLRFAAIGQIKKYEKDIASVLVG